MIHRFHWTAQGDILDAFKDYPGPFEFSFKYSVAHMYSIPNPPFIQPLLENLAPGRKTWLTVRNDDIYTFRFGDPAYAREYILNMPPADKMAGFYMGPDGYVWGRDFLERHPAPGPRPLGDARSNGIRSCSGGGWPTIPRCRTPASSGCWPPAIPRLRHLISSVLFKAPRRSCR